MNSQFRNSNFGFILYAAIISIIVIATGFVIWFMTVGYRVGTYGPDTRIGSVYIGGLTEEEIIPLLDERIDYWYNDDTIRFEVIYQDYSYEIDRDLILFNLETSKNSIKDGEANKLLAYFQGPDRIALIESIQALPYIVDIADNIDVELLVNDILKDAALMKSLSSKQIEDYLIDPSLEIEQLAVASFSVPEGVEIDDVIYDITTNFEEGKINIDGKHLFDTIEIFGALLNDSEMTMLSSAMLETILNTNFIVNEVHYEPIIDFSVYTIETFPYFARNSVINEIVGENFSFYNPNEYSYYFVVEKIDEFNGEVKLYGVPFEYDIQTTIHKTELNYITQATDDLTLLQNGYNGVIIEVQRVITDIYGEVIYNEVILFEFYPPIKEIIFEP